MELQKYQWRYPSLQYCCHAPDHKSKFQFFDLQSCSNAKSKPNFKLRNQHVLREATRAWVTDLEIVLTCMHWRKSCCPRTLIASEVFGRDRWCCKRVCKMENTPLHQSWCWFAPYAQHPEVHIVFQWWGVMKCLRWIQSQFPTCPPSNCIYLIPAWPRDGNSRVYLAIATVLCP